MGLVKPTFWVPGVGVRPTEAGSTSARRSAAQSEGNVGAADGRCYQSAPPLPPGEQGQKSRWPALGVGPVQLLLLSAQGASLPAVSTPGSSLARRWQAAQGGRGPSHLVPLGRVVDEGRVLVEVHPPARERHWIAIGGRRMLHEAAARGKPGSRRERSGRRESAADRASMGARRHMALTCSSWGTRRRRHRTYRHNSHHHRRRRRCHSPAWSGACCPARRSAEAEGRRRVAAFAPAAGDGGQPQSRKSTGVPSPPQAAHWPAAGRQRKGAAAPLTLSHSAEL